MEQRIRNTAGFYNGAGVTPAPTPVPTTDQATYRVVEWNGASVKVLCDKYGRLFVWKDTTSDNIVGVAWTAEGIDNTFDNIDQHEQAFTEIIHTYGYNDAVRGLGVDNYVIEIGGEEVEFSFQDGQLVPVASQWQQGATPMFFYRTLNDGTNDVTVVCAPDGKLYVNDYDGYLIKGQNGYAWSIGEAPQALVTNAGGKVTMDAYTDEDETTIISMDGYTVVIDLDGLVTVGAITEWPDPQNLFYRVCPVNDIATPVIVNENGEVCYVDHDGNFSVLRYNVATGVITEDATDAVLNACEAFTGGSNELELSTDASGNTIYTNGDYHIAVNNSGAIVEGRISEFESQNIIPVVGTVQVFADSGCTKYYSSKYAEKVYVRLNQQFTEGVEYGDSKLTSFEINQNANAMSLYYDYNAPANLPKAAGIYELDLEPDRTGIYFNNAVVFGNE